MERANNKKMKMARDLEKRNSAGTDRTGIQFKHIQRKNNTLLWPNICRYRKKNTEKNKLHISCHQHCREDGFCRYRGFFLMGIRAYTKMMGKGDGFCRWV